MAFNNRLISAHGTVLAVIGDPGTLGCAPKHVVTEHAVPIVSRSPISNTDYVILTANSDEQISFSIPPDPRRLGTFIIRSARSPKSGNILLISAQTQLFLLAAPPDASRATDPVSMMSDTADAWEHFAAEELPESQICPGAIRRLDRAERLVASNFSHAALHQMLSGPADVDTKDIFDAALPHIRTSELDDLASAIVADKQLQRSLTKHFPNDPWATLALPQLSELVGDERRSEAREPPAKKLPPTVKNLLSGILISPNNRAANAVCGYGEKDTSNVRQIDPDLDLLSTQGLNGDYVSLPYACNARARRKTKPAREFCIVATCRNEGIYILEWIAYYKLMGVDHFFIYSNDNEDVSDALLAALAAAGEITWFNNRMAAHANPQRKAYAHALNILPDTLGYRWALIVDLDEFLVIDDARFTSIQDFGKLHEDRPTDSIAINWNLFAAEMAPPGSALLTRRNTRVLRPNYAGEGWRLVKSMSRPNRIINSEAHVPFSEEREILTTRRASGELHTWHRPPEGFPYSPKWADHYSCGVAVINHYVAKSPGEWLWKRSRNSGNGQRSADGSFLIMDEHSLNLFMIQMEATDLRVDVRAVDTSPNIEREISRLEALPGISEAVGACWAAYSDRLHRIRETYRLAPQTKDWGERARRFLTLAGVTIDP